MRLIYSEVLKDQQSYFLRFWMLKNIEKGRREDFTGCKTLNKVDPMYLEVIYLFIYLLNFIYRWYIKIAFANKFQPYHKIQYNIYYIFLHIKHLQSISPIFLILLWNSNNELLDFTTAERLFHIRELRK